MPPKTPGSLARVQAFFACGQTTAKKKPHRGAGKALRLVAREVSDGDESRSGIYYKSISVANIFVLIFYK
jgi:hypothetical protein